MSERLLLVAAARSRKWGTAASRTTSPSLLYHVRNRDYQPEDGRWLQRDPAGYIDGLNLYLYTLANPLIGTDPLGLKFWAPSASCGSAADVEAQTLIPDANGNGNGLIVENQTVNSPLGDQFKEYFLKTPDAPYASPQSCGVGEFLVQVVSVALEPVDVGIGIWETAKDPSNPLNWLSIIPIPGVPGTAVRHADDVAGAVASAVRRADDTSAASAKATQLAKNKSAGKAAEAQAAKDLIAEGNTILGSQVSARTAEGRRIIDHLVQDANGTIRAVEVKSGGAVRNASQRAKDNALATQGGILVGKNVPAELRGKHVIIDTVERRYK